MTHLTEGQFQQLYDESITFEQAEALWQHMDGCDFCLDRLNEWYEECNISLTMDTQVVNSDAFQHKLMRRIHREEAAKAVINFGYHGMAAVFKFFIQSIFASGSK